MSDVPASARHFPKVARLVDLGGGSDRWELEKVGAGAVSIQTIYASTYVADKKKGRVVWTPVKGEGNAQVGGSWALVDKKKSTHLTLKIYGEIVVPLPGLMEGVVAPLVTAENEKLVEQYIDKLTTVFGGEV